VDFFLKNYFHLFTSAATLHKVVVNQSKLAPYTSYVDSLFMNTGI